MLLLLRPCYTVFCVYIRISTFLDKISNCDARLFSTKCSVLLDIRIGVVLFTSEIQQKTEFIHLLGLQAKKRKRKKRHTRINIYLVRVAPDCNRSYCEDSFSAVSYTHLTLPTTPYV